MYDHGPKSTLLSKGGSEPSSEEDDDSIIPELGDPLDIILFYLGMKRCVENWLHRTTPFYKNASVYECKQG